MLLLHPALTCADGCWCPVCLIFSNLHWWCFSFQQLVQTLYLHLWWLPPATCTGVLFPSSNGTYTACTYCNLHCLVLVLLVVYLCGCGRCMWQCWLYVNVVPVVGNLQESPPSVGYLALMHHKPVTAITVFSSDAEQYKIIM